jgi:hypothetical protein
MQFRGLDESDDGLYQGTVQLFLLTVHQSQVVSTPALHSREEMRNAYQILVGNPEGKRSLVRPWSRWEGNILILS